MKIPNTGAPELDSVAAEIEMISLSLPDDGKFHRVSFNGMLRMKEDGTRDVAHAMLTYDGRKQFEIGERLAPSAQEPVREFHSIFGHARNPESL